MMVMVTVMIPMLMSLMMIKDDVHETRKVVHTHLSQETTRRRQIRKLHILSQYGALRRSKKKTIAYTYIKVNEGEGEGELTGEITVKLCLQFWCFNPSFYFCDLRAGGCIRQVSVYRLCREQKKKAFGERTNERTNERTGG